MLIGRTQSQPERHAAMSDWAHTPKERGPNAESARTVAVVAQSCFDFMAERVWDKEGGGRITLLWGIKRRKAKTACPRAVRTILYSGDPNSGESDLYVPCSRERKGRRALGEPMSKCRERHPVDWFQACLLPFGIRWLSRLDMFYDTRSQRKKTVSEWNGHG
jgi:hypothetical protein